MFKRCGLIQKRKALRRFYCLVGIIFFFLISAQGVFGSQASIKCINCGDKRKELPSPDANEILIKYKNHIRIKNKYKITSHYSHIRDIPGLNIDRIKVDSGANISEAIKLIRNENNIDYVEPNYRTSCFSVKPNDSLFADNWVVKRLALQRAWEITKGDSNVKIGFLDTGLDTNNIEFAGRIVPGYDFIHNNVYSFDDHGHGTTIAGIACATGNNTYGIAGINWYSKIMPIKVLDSSGVGTVADMVDGILFAIAHNVDILCISAGTLNYSQTLKDAIDSAYKAGARSHLFDRPIPLLLDRFDPLSKAS
ncbi:MAG: S8 family serine peptidase [Methylococcales bacterium]|nr:S8 family serine peptidase [Methylococcales bacterium]